MNKKAKLLVTVVTTFALLAGVIGIIYLNKNILSSSQSSILTSKTSLSSIISSSLSLSSLSTTSNEILNTWSDEKIDPT
jgi:hypothetical protein